MHDHVDEALLSITHFHLLGWYSPYLYSSLGPTAEPVEGVPDSSLAFSGFRFTAILPINLFYTTLLKRLKAETNHVRLHPTTLIHIHLIICHLSYDGD
jgi:hypothetical protein